MACRAVGPGSRPCTWSAGEVALRTSGLARPFRGWTRNHGHHDRPSRVEIWDVAATRWAMGVVMNDYTRLAEAATHVFKKQSDDGSSELAELWARLIN
eukprot:CAMPEP_0117664366 /NCGR_PEP_ID=MMETSP0804-20121206/9179_1 /TAXON_ID=1074897 /ORGANISM="Tetraselmis astigmatica, Strain CCMP880" /LENGTH=97 /DNA_ID=CAMNT_0005471589 /DNA_START=379 /DNA_END=672 /DNA_ORIENTATION=+